MIDKDAEVQLMQQRNPYIPLAGGVIAVSFAAVFIKLAAAPSLVIASYRMLFAWLLVMPAALWKSRDELRKVSRRNLLLMICSGISLALHFATWISSFGFTTVASSTVLVSMQPIFAVVFSWLLFRERISRRQLIAIVIAVVGSIVIGLADVNSATAGSASLWGNTLALLGAVFAAVYFLCGKAVRQTVPLLPYVSIVYGVSALTLIAITLRSGIALRAYGPYDYLLFLGLAVVCTVVGHSTLNWALAHLPAAAVGVAVLGEPIGATLWAMALFAEVPSGGQLLGGGLLLTGILLFMLPARAKAGKQRGAARQG